MTEVQITFCKVRLSGAHPLMLLLEHVLVQEVLLLQQHLLVLLRCRLLRSIVMRRRHARLRP